jgi:hypothetical protein
MRLARDAVGGAIIVALAAGTLVALSRIPQARYQAISPDLFPRVCAWLLVGAGAALMLRGLLRGGERLDLPGLRSVSLVILAVLAFGYVTPTHGYLAGGFLTLVISGLATREARPAQLLVFSIGMIAFSVVLFSFILKVPMPILAIGGLRY